MSYLTIKNGIIGIMNALSYQESNESWDMTNASSAEYANTFILKALSGEATDDSEQLADRFYDKQEWEIQLAFDQSSNSEGSNIDIANIKKDTILAKLDDPASWVSFARMMKYKSWKLEETPNYFLLTITLTVIDVYTY